MAHLVLVMTFFGSYLGFRDVNDFLLT